MNIKKVIPIISIIIIILSIVLIISFINNTNSKITTNAITQQGQVGVVIEQRCGDGYCIEETCGGCPADCGACSSAGTTSGGSSVGGGGSSSGPAIAEKITDFFIQPDFIKQNVKAGSESFSTFKVVSRSTKDVIINIKLEKENLVKITPKIFNLEQNQEKTVNIKVKTNEETIPGLYYYNISVESGNIKKKLLYLLLVVKSKIVYFDATIGLSEESRIIKKEKKITINPTLFNLGDIINEKVTVKYFIKDLNLNNIYESSENLIVNNQISYTKNIELPTYLQPGKYIVGINLKYKDSVGISTDLFEVIGDEKIQNNIKSLKIQSILIIIIIFISTLLIIQHKKLLNIEKISNKKIKHFNYLYKQGHDHKVINKKIESHINLLNKSYKQGYIKRDIYNKFKRDLNQINSKLNKK